MTTIQMANIYIDKILCEMPHEEIEKDKYLWGVTSLLLASKYNEVLQNCLHIKDLVKISRRAVFPTALITVLEK